MTWQGLAVVHVVIVRMLGSVLGYVSKLFLEMRAQESQGIAIVKWHAALLCCTFA
jgi:putative effector of murein hydrolase